MVAFRQRPGLVGALAVAWLAWPSVGTGTVTAPAPAVASAFQRQVVQQAGTIVGRVVDAKTRAEVSGAEIYLEQSRWHAVADSVGRYQLAEVDTGSYTLTVLRLGYTKWSRRVTVHDRVQDTVDVALEPVVARLQDLVTTATGRQLRLDIANDVTTINADSVMQAAPVRSVTDLLETRVPGLSVQHTSGTPGDPSRLRLRGISSPLRSNDPIVIVDGIRVYSEQSASRSTNLARPPQLLAGGSIVDSVGTGYTTATPSPLDHIDPNSIETVEVLKGPSAATLYGQDAANGVIVITTKKGHAGHTQWTARVERGRTQMESAYPELLLRWGHTLVDNRPVRCPVTDITYLSGSPAVCQGDSLVAFQLLNDPALTVLDRGHRTAASLGVSGGTAALTYAVTGSYAGELGLIKLPDYEADRYQTSLGMSPPDWMRRPQHLTQWGATTSIRAQLGAKADVSLKASLSRTEQQKSSLQDQLGDLMSTYLDRGNGTYYSRTARSILSGYDYGIISTPLASYYERATDRATQFTNGVALSYRPRAWLALTADAGLDVDQRVDQTYFPRGPAGAGGTIGNDTTGRVSDAQGTAVTSTVNLRANAFQPLGHGFQFHFALGANYAGVSTTDVATGTNNLAPGSSLQGAEIAFTRRAETSDATFGWYVEPAVGNGKFNFTSGLRLDGGSSYGSSVSGVHLPTFPKLGGTYLLSEEPWFPLKDLVQSFRLRLSYGKASRQPGPKDRLRIYSVPGQVFVDSQFVTGTGLQMLGNTQVRPERSTELEGGFDVDLLDSRLSLTMTGYRKTTDDALLAFPVATSVYGDNVDIVKNIGVIRNMGLELEASAQFVRSGPLTWTTRLQLSQNRNVVVSLGPGVAPFYTADHLNPADGGIRIAAGYPLFGRWSRPILGYADANGNGVLEPAEIQLGDTAVYTGPTLPNYEANLATTVSLWHGAFTINAGMQFLRGLAQRNEVALRLAPFSRGRQDPTASLAEQLATMDLTNVASGGSDYNWIQTVNTTRFQSVSVMYSVPATVARRLGAQTLRVAIQGANLGLWTSYRGLDPNVNGFGTGNNVTDTGVLPLPRTWQVQVHATY